MRLIGYLTMTTSLVVGAIATTTAYVPVLTGDDAWLAVGPGYAHLNAPAGAERDATGALRVDDAGSRIALVETGTELTPGVQAQLRAAGVQRVRVKEFSLARWQYAWLFAVAVIGLVSGGLVVKRDARQEVLRQVANASARPQGSPQHAVRQIVAVAQSLQRDLPNMSSDPDRVRAIIDRIDRVQKELSLQVTDGRSVLIGRLGLSGFAEFMTAFSRLERTLNRAWSAAADGVVDEALSCVDEAVEYAPEVEKKLG